MRCWLLVFEARKVVFEAYGYGSVAGEDSENFYVMNRGSKP
jgi:hypothetical protein